MRKLLVALAFFASGTAIGKPAFGSAEELNRWLTYYYLKPQPELAVASLPMLDAAMREHKCRSLADEVSRGGLRTFYAKVFEANDSAVAELEAARPGLSPEVRAFAQEALRRCASAECARVAGPSEHGESDGEASVSMLDDAWAAFMATGDTRFVDEVIAALPLVEVRGDTRRLLVGSAAKWSLASNAYQHERVLEACEAALLHADPTTKRLLEAIVAEAKAERTANPPAVPR
jgi:hypothetical protein